jgi:hypothetical protein
MKDIICPHCEKAFTIDETGYADIVKQVRNSEFNQDLHERLEIADQKKQAEVELAKTKVAKEMQEIATAKDTQIQGLEAEVKNADMAQTLAVTTAVRETEKERDTFKNGLDQAELSKELATKSLEEHHKIQMQNKDDLIAQLRDFKTRLSTKMIGQSLEDHCENKFNSIRATAFARAEFDKDNDVTSGSKGDYIFRDFDEDGTEIVSIMFDMKNEEDATATKKTNEAFLKKLDKDRRDKNCEYAVLVSMLELDSELYNEGIVDVSHHYPRMYVIRPQSFISIISLLRNMGVGALEYKTELAMVKAQDIDITNFQSNLEDHKTDVDQYYQWTKERFDKAIAEIDKSIDHLEKTKEQLRLSGKHFGTANNKLQKITIRKLTRGNPTMTARFEEIEDQDLS